MAVSAPLLRFKNSLTPPNPAQTGGSYTEKAAPAWVNSTNEP